MSTLPASCGLPPNEDDPIALQRTNVVMFCQMLLALVLVLGSMVVSVLCMIEIEHRQRFGQRIHREIESYLSIRGSTDHPQQWATDHPDETQYFDDLCSIDRELTNLQHFGISGSSSAHVFLRLDQAECRLKIATKSNSRPSQEFYESLTRETDGYQSKNPMVSSSIYNLLALSMVPLCIIGALAKFLRPEPKSNGMASASATTGNQLTKCLILGTITGVMTFIVVMLTLELVVGDSGLDGCNAYFLGLLSLFIGFCVETLRSAALALHQPHSG